MAMEALYYWALRDAVSLAQAAENPQDARTYSARAEKPMADGSKQSFALRSGRTYAIALDSAAANTR